MQTQTTPQKIMLVITKSNWGGAQKYVHDLACELQKDPSLSVSVLAGGNGDMVKRLKDTHVRVIEIPNLIRDISLTRDIKSFLWLISLFRKERPDVIHLNSSKIGFVGALAGRLAGVKKIVFTAHGWAFNEERPYYQKVIFRGIYLATVIMSHVTIFVSENTRTQLHAPSFLKSKSVIVHNGIPPLIFAQPHAFFTERNITKKERIALVSIGELHTVKGFDLVLNYLAQLKDLSWEWHVLGEGQERKNLEKQIIELGLEGRVFLHGHTPNAASYLTSFDIFLLPSRSEALAYVAIEAIQTTLPVVVSNVGGLPEIFVNDKGATLINIRDSKTAEVFRDILSHDVQKIDDSVRTAIREEFSLHHMFEKTKTVYGL